MKYVWPKGAPCLTPVLLLALFGALLMVKQEELRVVSTVVLFGRLLPGIILVYYVCPTGDQVLAS
jgi:hypothetical protein